MDLKSLVTVQHINLITTITHQVLQGLDSVGKRVLLHTLTTGKSADKQSILVLGGMDKDLSKPKTCLIIELIWMAAYYDLEIVAESMVKAE